jgi:hypothetical protein
VVSGSPRIRPSFLRRKIFETGFGKTTASTDCSTNACAGYWRLILSRSEVSGFSVRHTHFIWTLPTAIYHWHMKHVITNFVLVISILQGMPAAQTPYVDRYPNVEELLQRLGLGGEVQAQTETQIQIAKRKEADYKEQQFLSKAKKLVQTWSTFAREYNEKGTFNLKTA